MIIIRADRAKAKAVNKELLTSGMVGSQVKFVFSNEWNGLNKTAVFRAGDVTIDVLDSQWDGNICTIPNECLATSGNTITVGIYGCNNDGDLIIPTVYATVGTVRVGANPYGDDNANPGLPVYEQIRSSIGKLSDLDTVDKSNLVAAINEAAQTAADAVTYTEQSLTDEQKAQVRENIGVVEIADLPTVYPHPITRIESLDKTNIIALRNLDSGTYVLYGYFKPFDGSTSTMTFGSNILVSIVKKTSESHVQIFYPNNNCVQYVKITDDSYERKNIYLNDLNDTVRFDEAQELTEDQQTQALENIRAVDKYNGLKRYDVEYASSWGTGLAKRTVYTNGVLIQPEDLSTSTEIGLAWAQFMSFLGMTISTKPEIELQCFKSIAKIADAGYLGDDFWETTYDTRRIFTINPTNLDQNYIYINAYNVDTKTVWAKHYYHDAYCENSYSLNTDEFGKYVSYTGAAIKPTVSKLDDTPTVSQFQMKTDPTSDMQVATKQYVDNTVEDAKVQPTIPKIESLDESNIQTFRSLEDGTYILEGYFTPYTGSDSTLIFDPPALVSINSTESETHVQIFEAYDNQIQHLIITDTSCETTYVLLNDLVSSASKIGDLSTLKTTAKDILVDAINEAASAIPAVTESDNGKILQVVDGAWAAAAIPNAEEVSF